MKYITLEKFAVFFKHPRGWTFLCVKDTANDARKWINRQVCSPQIYQYSIRPCNIEIKVPDKLHSQYLGESGLKNTAAGGKRDQ